VTGYSGQFTPGGYLSTVNRIIRMDDKPTKVHNWLWSLEWLPKNSDPLKNLEEKKTIEVYL